MLAHRYRLPFAAVVAAIAAGGATVLLRPRAGVVKPAPASAGDYFTPAQLEKARNWARPQRLIGLGSMLVEGAAFTLLVARRPPILDRLGRRPLAGAALAGAGLSAAMTVVALPLAIVAERRSRRFGLSVQRWGPWFADLGKSTAIGAVMAGGGSALAIGVIRRSPRSWWIPGAAGVVGLSSLLVFLAPVVIDPIFNKFEPLPDGDLRREVLELAARSNVDVGEVYRVDASRRTTATNAYVWGLGRTKRVVIYDTLIRDYPSDQVRSVVAHELSHVVSRDVLRGLAWLAVAAPAGTFLVKELAERLNGGRTLGEPAALPALALAGGLVAGVLGPLSNLLSRRVEARADTFALDLTGDPRSFIDLSQALAITNLADPSTPRVLHLVFGTHPTTMQRIGAALQWERAHSSTAGQGP
jgi:STE24 endopeptidase